MSTSAVSKDVNISCPGSLCASGLSVIKPAAEKKPFLAADEYAYTEAFVQPAMAAHPRPQSVLLLGTQESNLLREILRHKCVQQVTAVADPAEMPSRDLEGQPFDDERVKLVSDSPSAFVSSGTGIAFDVAIVTAPMTPERSLEAFFQALKAKLSSKAVLTLRTLALSEDGCFEQRRFVQELRPIFDFVSSYSCYVPSLGCEWGFIMASDTIVPAALDVDAVDGALTQRGVARQLRFYDGIAHQRMFSLPKDVRAKLNAREL